MADIEIIGGRDNAARGTYRVRKELVSANSEVRANIVGLGVDTAFIVTDHPPARLITSQHRLKELSNGDLTYIVDGVDARSRGEIRLLCRSV